MEEELDFKPVVLILVDPITESLNNFGVRDPVLDLVTILPARILMKVR